MGWVLRLVESGADGSSDSVDVLEIERPGDLGDLADLGLTHAEGKELLARVQQAVVAAQSRDHAARRPACQTCGAACRLKDYRPRQIATLFGAVTVRLPRFHLSLSRLSHWLPGSQAHPKVMQGAADFHHDIADTLLPQTDPVSDDAAALDTAVDMLDAQAAGVERPVRPLLRRRQVRARGFLCGHEDLHLGQREAQKAEILQQPAPGR